MKSLVIVFLIMIFSMGNLIAAQDEPSLCQTNNFLYALVEFMPTMKDGVLQAPSAPVILKLRTINSDGSEINADPLGLILRDSATVTIYSDRQVSVNIYAVRPEASISGLRWVNTRQEEEAIIPIPVVTTVSSREQNNFNQKSETFINTLNCDSSSLQATRPIDVLGGKPLYDLEANQIEAVKIDQSKVTRRTTLVDDFFTHELIVINQNLDQAVPTFRGSASLHFDNSNLAFQIIQLGNNPIEFAVPSLTDNGPLYLISDHKPDLSTFTFIDEERIELESSTANPRDNYLKTRNITDPAQFFDEMSADGVAIFPSYGVRANYDPVNYMRLQLLEFATPAESDARSLNCSRVQPLEGSKPRLFLPDGRYFSMMENVANTGQHNNAGQLEVDVNGRYLVESWLVECVAAS